MSNSFIVKTPKCNIFSRSKYFGEIKLKATRDIYAKTFTIQVLGVRGHCNAGWDFGQRVNLSLRSGTTTVIADSSTGYYLVPRSNSNTHTGYMPKSGWYTSAESMKISITVKAKSDGTCPAVYLWYKNYNPGVYYISGNTKQSVCAEYSGNISEVAQAAAGGPIDVIPTIGVNDWHLSNTSGYSPDYAHITPTVSSDVHCKRGSWYYCLTPQDESTPRSSEWKAVPLQYCGEYGFSGFKIRDIPSGQYRFWVKAKSYATDTETVYTENFDCRIPEVADFTLQKLPGNKAKIRFRVHYDYTWDLQYEGTDPWTVVRKHNSTKTEASQYTEYEFDIKKPNEVQQYALRVHRAAHSSLTGLYDDYYFSIDSTDASSLQTMFITHQQNNEENPPAPYLKVSVNYSGELTDWKLYEYSWSRKNWVQLVEGTDFHLYSANNSCRVYYVTPRTELGNTCNLKVVASKRMNGVECSLARQTLLYRYCYILGSKGNKHKLAVPYIYRTKSNSWCYAEPFVQRKETGVQYKRPTEKGKVT